MERLYKGNHQFQSADFRNDSEFFKRLSHWQQPEVLFIICDDLRVDPNRVIQSRPGGLFIVRNAGNVVPPHNAIGDKNSVAEAIEFSVLGLRVTDIIVCGHSNCGAMELLLKHDGFFVDMPRLKEWVRIAEPARHIITKHYPDASDESKSRIMEKENVLMQIWNIETYPFVKNALEQGTLKLHGWYYDIVAGKRFAYNAESDEFEAIS